MPLKACRVEQAGGGQPLQSPGELPPCLSTADGAWHLPCVESGFQKGTRACGGGFRRQQESTKSSNQTSPWSLRFLQSYMILLPCLFFLLPTLSTSFPPRISRVVTIFVFPLLSWLSINLTGLRILSDLVMRSQIYLGGSQLMAVLHPNVQPGC